MVKPEKVGLVLTRKERETIILDIPASAAPQRVVISVVAIRGNSVRLGTLADKRINIARSEMDS